MLRRTTAVFFRLWQRIVRSVVLKLWLTIIVLVMVVLAILAMYLQQFFASYVSTMQRRDLTSQALLVSQLLQQEPGRVLTSQIAHVMSALHSHYYLIAPPTVSPTVSRFLGSLTPAEQTLLRRGQPVVQRGIPSFIPSPDPRTSMYALMPILGPVSQVSAFLLITESNGVAGDPGRTIPDLIIFAVVLGTLLTTGLAFVVSKNLSRPLIEMNDAAEKMARGRFDMRVTVVTQDEVGRLGHTLNQVAEELELSLRALTEEKEQIAGILRAMTDAVVVTDMHGRFILRNPAAEQWMQTLRALRAGDEGPYALPQDLVRMQRDTLGARTSIERSVEWRGRDLLVTMTPLYEPDDQDRLRGTLAVIRDVTEQRRLDRLRKDFVTNVSHELRTPLALLQGYAEALVDDFGEDPAQRQEITQIIHDESLRMRRLVNELLDLAQLESAHFSMRMEALDLTALTRKIVRKFQGIFVDHGLFLTAESSGGPVLTCGDSDRLEQVLTNLVDNALRHTAQGGVTLRLDVTEDQAILRVIDTGVGIASEDIPFVFERFYKADKSRTRTRGGTGLGLAIARSLIHAHHGDIGVESTVGAGTTFSIVLPILSGDCTEL
ncbi:MAG: HAMP domain-containing sensor histidine kinase [Bacilli bacterium]